MHSSNGTLLNGEQIDSAAVQNGDLISVGITTFRVAYSRLPETVPPKVIFSDQLA